MTGNVINLRQARKQRERDARRKKADENREKHGRKRAEREQAARDAEAQARRLDGHWLSQVDAEAVPDREKEQDASGDPSNGRQEP
ncbi:MAG: DUF4169 family protein [Hyphomicrobiaceae bacterium]